MNPFPSSFSFPLSFPSPLLRARVHVFEGNGSFVETLMSSSFSFFLPFLQILLSTEFRIFVVIALKRQTSRVTYKRSGSPTSFYASFNCSTAIHRWRRGYLQSRGLQITSGYTARCNYTVYINVLFIRADMIIIQMV